MKRVLLITLLVAFAVVVCAIPYWFGVEAERIYRHQITSLGDSNKVTVLENHFERGWLRSYAESEVVIVGTNMVVLAKHTIEHGPLPVSDPLQHLFSLRPLQALIRSTMIAHTAGQPDEELATGTLLTRVNIDGTARTRVSVPAGAIQIEPTTLSWEHTSGHVDFDPTRGSWQGSFNLNGALWREGGASISVGLSDLDFLAYQGSRGLALGSSTLSTEALEGMLPEFRTKFAAKNLVIDSTASEQDNRVSYTLGGKMESADFIDLKINSGDWTVMIENLDLDSLAKLNEMEVGGAIPLNELMALISKHQAKFESSLQLATHSGPFTATAEMRLSDSSGSTNPLVLLSALVGNVVLDMPDTVVQMIARSTLQADRNKDPGSSVGEQGDIDEAAVSNKIQSWVNGNFLTKQGNRYRFHAAISNGAILLNGRPFNLMSLLR